MTHPHEPYRTLALPSRVHFLASLAFHLSEVARVCYPRADDLPAPALVAANELSHLFSKQILRELRHGEGGYPDETFFAIIEEVGAPHASELNLRWAIRKAYEDVDGAASY